MNTETTELNMDDKNKEVSDDIKKYASNDHRMSFLLDPVQMEMYVDYGKSVTRDEMVEASIQVATNILDHLPLEDQADAAQEIIDELRQYIVEKHAQA